MSKKDTVEKQEQWQKVKEIVGGFLFLKRPGLEKCSFRMSKMEDANTEMASSAPAKVGVILADLGKLNITALKYLNTLQASIEFELLAPDSDDPLLVSLAKDNVVDRKTCRSMLSHFRERIIRQFEKEQAEYGLTDQSLPDNYVVISLAKFSDEHYGLKAGHVQVQALGNWERQMAPPSILEFIIVLLMRQAASFDVASLSKSLHLGTKGCLFDFTSDLGEARYKALQAFVCSACRARMQESGETLSNLATAMAVAIWRVDVGWFVKAFRQTRPDSSAPAHRITGDALLPGHCGHLE